MISPNFEFAIAYVSLRNDTLYYCISKALYVEIHMTSCDKTLMILDLIKSNPVKSRLVYQCNSLHLIIWLLLMHE